MPNKECPECKKSNHVRVAKCECGYVFYTKKVKEELEVKKEVVVHKEDKPPTPSIIKKAPINMLKELAEELKYSVTGNRAHKLINGVKYNAIVTNTGRITGAIRST